MNDNVNPAGELAGGGLAHALSQGLFGEKFICSNEAEEAVAFRLFKTGVSR